MLSGLLIVLDILVCIALVGVVLLQRSEGGAFGMGGGPTGLVTARGAGDLLTRTTWVLFALFLALSVGLTLLGAHDRASSSVLERLKLQQANPNALSQPLPAPANTLPAAPGGAQPGSPLMAPPPAAPLSAPSPQAAPSPTAQAPAAAPRATHQRKAAEAQPALEAPSPQPAAPPTLEAPAPQSAPAAPQPAPAAPQP
jgi:preprotein translocase subunit SecG